MFQWCSAALKRVSHHIHTWPAPYPRPFLLLGLLAPGCGERLFSRRRSVGVLSWRSACFAAALISSTPAFLAAGLGCKLSSWVPRQNPEQDACLTCNDISWLIHGSLRWQTLHRL